MLLALACSTSDRFADGGARDPDSAAAPEDGGQAGAGGSRFGAACAERSDCGRNLFCDTEVDLTIRVQSGEEVVGKSFPDGVCTPVPAAPFDPEALDSCNPLGPPANQGCGANGVCVSVPLRQMSVVACRPECEPQADASGCDRSFYTCDLDQRACVEGCLSDAECQLRLLPDSNADGRPEVEVAAESEAYCDLDTYRCTHNGGASAQTGDPCELPDDCEPDGTCIQPLQRFAGIPFPEGACTKIGCDIEGRECRGDNAVCERLRAWDRGFITAHLCLQRCTVGAEPEADQLGPEGHGDGCREGYRCHYNGGSGEESGVCVGGNYNDVAASNLGASCMADAECYSPFGHGSCLLLGVADIRPTAGTCTIMDCNAPGLPDDICGPDGQCVSLPGDTTYCARTCVDAEQCAEGYACADDDLDPTTGKICFPACISDDECRKDVEICAISPMSGAGACVASDE
jgi:hypothetical protein